MASYSTGITGLGSTSRFSKHTAFSYQPSSVGFFDTKSLASFEDIKPRRRCKAKREMKARSQGRKFQCTFCRTRTFKTKHNWQRHEKSRNFNIESWACCAFGPTIETFQGPTCVFCNLSNPDSEHLDIHHYSACQDKELSERTFNRKDHFKQHLMLVHECDIHESMKIWKFEFPTIISRCGFCNMQLGSWQERVDHLASHFKAGSKMASWKGDMGFEAHVACMIDFGPDDDPKRFHPHPYYPTSSVVETLGTEADVSSLIYQGDAGDDLSDELLHRTLVEISGGELRHMGNGFEEELVSSMGNGSACQNGPY